MKKAYIDGAAGTTGLKLETRLKTNPNIEILKVDERARKDLHTRLNAIQNADVTFLCLPDDAAREIIMAADGLNGFDSIIIDASTAFRTNKNWTYGFPELNEAQRERIAVAKRISVPGCHATGFIALVKPLVEANIIKSNERLSCTSLTGYSGGGKKMIDEYESENRSGELAAPRPYALGQNHKHLPEMVYYTDLELEPIFVPVVVDCFSGMLVTVSLNINVKADELREVYKRHYSNERFINIMESPRSGFIAMNETVGTNNLNIYVEGVPGKLTLTAVLDNLGKGSSGAAIQCMNIALKLDEEYVG